MFDCLLLCTRYTTRVRCQRENCNDCVTEAGLGKREFKDLLKDHRLARGHFLKHDLRGADVARAVGVSRAAYNNWERGIRKPRDVGTAQRLADYLAVTLDDLGLDVAALPLTAQPRRHALGHKENKRPFKPGTTRRRKENE
jgi:transcriptional regulator with XRE-family HTH domain